MRSLAEKGQVIWPLLPINALMSFYTLLANVGEPFGEKGIGVEQATGVSVLNEMASVTKNIPEQCFFMDPINAYEWLASRSDASYVPHLYGYTNYSRDGFRPHLVKVANIPVLGDTGTVGSTIGGAGIAISANIQHADTALKYAYWIASEECQSEIFFKAGGQPANIVAWKDSECNRVANNFFKNTLKTLESSYLRPRHNGYMAFQDIGGELIHAFLAGQKSASITIASINENYERSFI